MAALLRARFAGNRRGPGPVMVDGNRLPPSKVLRGKPIFGQRRSFVPESQHSGRLWRVLGIRTPTLSDCVDVLKEIAHTAPDKEDDQVLLNTYVDMSERVAEATRSEHALLSTLPLWSGRRWLKERPVYAVEDIELVSSLAEKLPVWQPPASPQSLGELIEALNVTLLRDRDFTPSVGDAEREAGQAFADTFAGAVAHLREATPEGRRRAARAAV